MSLKIDSSKKLRKEKSKWESSGDWEEVNRKEDEYHKERLRHKSPTITGKVRVTGGIAKNIMIDIPKTTRPLTDRMKVRIFDILKEDIVNKKVLDLYAGTGSFAIEALSRGAKSAVVVDAAKQANIILQKNFLKTGFTDKVEIIRSKVDDYLIKTIKTDKKFEIIFLDPPYKLFNTKHVFKMEKTINLASQLLPLDQKFKGVIIIKHPKRYPINTLNFEKLKILETFAFGLNSVTFLIVKE
ncbi:MAG: RsmD family RNA methyltransferase [Candidatus Dojkabacteria bacterium]|nr:RsmD family RNA methyltransferase [Candidatus Dojkabacteria bacterium]